MSYTEYLRRKAAGSPVVIDRRTNTDASMYTMRQRHLASSVFFKSNRIGAINNTVDVTTNPQKAIQSYVKDTGRVPDASSFISHSAAWQLPLVEGKITLDPCCVPVLGPAPKSASDWVRDSTICCTQPHTADELGPALFVDNTIRLKHLVGCCENEVNKAIHTHPEPTPYASWSPRPEKGAGGIPVYTVSSPSDARKVGNFNPRKIPYVENKHGNDLKVNPRRVPGPFIPNTGIPHLKINDAFPRGCGTCGITYCQTCQDPQSYESSMNDITPSETYIDVSPYIQDVAPCIGDKVALTYTSDSNILLTFDFELSAQTAVQYIYNGGIAVTITPTGTGPYFYGLNDVALNIGDTLTVTATINNCNVSPILFRYSTLPNVS